jgi:hypothetical protein
MGYPLGRWLIGNAPSTFYGSTREPGTVLASAGRLAQEPAFLRDELLVGQHAVPVQFAELGEFVERVRWRPEAGPAPDDRAPPPNCASSV